jgi:branched-chain amino acid transport system substrate-binding protein
VLARWLGLAALLAALPVIGGCGGVTASETTGNQLTVYSSLPLQGPSAAISQQLIGGEKLALSHAGGHVGAFKISYVSLDDANPVNGQVSPGESSTAAKVAAQDTSAIAYIGDLGSASTAISLPIINEAGVLQVSPASPYVGLTSSLDAGQDEPGRFYPTGKRSFARLQPGDPAQAAAQARLMRSLGVERVYVLDDQDPFEEPLATLVAGDAEHAGISVAAHDSLALPLGANLTGEVEKIVASKAQAVFLAAGGQGASATLWRLLHTADPHLLLLGSSSMASESFTSQIAGAASETYLTTPLLADSLYPPAARAVLAENRRTFDREAGPDALYGYEAMSSVLEAIRRAGPDGNHRHAVIDSFFSIPEHDSVIGRYSIEADGETSFSDYGVDRVDHGRPVFYRAIDTAKPLPASQG